MTSDINNPLVSHCFLFTMALEGMEPAPNSAATRREQKARRGSLHYWVSWCTRDELYEPLAEQRFSLARVPVAADDILQEHIRTVVSNWDSMAEPKDSASASLGFSQRPVKCRNNGQNYWKTLLMGNNTVTSNIGYSGNKNFFLFTQLNA